MKDERKVELDADLQREIREGRKFSLAEAIGRLAGPGMMKGVSPATRKQQADAELTSFLERNFNSPAGALTVVLARRVTNSELLLHNLDAPLVVLASYVQQILESEARLEDLVREADVEWGRTYGERPFFEKPGKPAHVDDPYTKDSVRAALTKLLGQVAESLERADEQAS